MNCPCFVIHRAKDKERECYVDALKKEFPNLVVFEGVNGEDLKGMPCQHPGEFRKTSYGNMGNTMTHFMIMKQTMDSKADKVCIFEDDAVVVGDYETFYKEFPHEWDILYLGVLEVVEGDKKEDCYEVWRSWGTHAVILKQTAMDAIMKTFKKTLQEGFFYPADTLYNRAIKDYKLKAYAPLKSHIIQQPGLLSFISGHIR